MNDRGSRLWLTCAFGLLLGCEGPQGVPGPQGPQGPPGGQADAGPPPDAGQPPDGGVASAPWNAGPGLVVQVLEADTSRVRFRLTDAAGVPLDREGRLTAGAVSPSFVLAWLDDSGGSPGLFRTYASRQVTSPITQETAEQAIADGGGSYASLGDGVYEYSFGTQVASPMTGKTHRVAIYATRTFGGVRWVDNEVHDFVVGSGELATRDIVTNEACNACHVRLEAHGGPRRDVEVCITCHTTQTTDPDTGNTVDMTTMIHKIHRGADLPSVGEGTPYRIIGFQQSVHDFSTVHFPHEVQSCSTCHQGTQGEVWATRPSMRACGSCHDLIAFAEPVPAGMTLHSGGTQPDDRACANCHPSEGGIAGIADAHLIALESPENPDLGLEILGVTSSGPGQIPEMTFRVTAGGAPRDILAQPLNTLRGTIAGPTTDHAQHWQATIQGGGASGTLTAVDAADGRFRYKFPESAAMPADARGSYSFALEGNLTVNGIRSTAYGPRVAAAVTDPAPVARREIVDSAKCNSCHLDLIVHGGNRRGVESCTMCHHPENVNDERVARFEGSTVDVESVDFKVMIHKIHRGEDLTQEYVLGGNPAPNAGNPGGNPVDFGHLRFPGDLRSCESCHLPGTYDLPLPAGVRPTRRETLTCTEEPGADADQFCNTREVEARYIAPATAVCTSCHDSPDTVAHAEVMTTAMGGESCATCHAGGSTFDTARFHTLDPMDLP